MRVRATLLLEGQVRLGGDQVRSRSRSRKPQEDALVRACFLRQSFEVGSVALREAHAVSMPPPQFPQTHTVLYGNTQLGS